MFMLNLIPMPYRILGSIAIILGIFAFGYYKGNTSADEKHKAQLAKAELRYAELQKKKDKVTEKVVKEYVDRVVYVTKWRTRNVTIATTVPVDNGINLGWVHVHNASVEGREADPALALDATASGIKTPEALTTIVENYGICKQNSEQLIALQEFVKQQEKLIDEFNRKQKK